MKQEKKIKILFAINHLGIGGAEKMVVGQINSIDRQIFDPFLLTIYPQPELNFLTEVNLSLDHKFGLIFKSVFDLMSWWRLLNFLRRENFEVVITNLFNTNCVVRLAAIICRRSLILSYEHNIYADKKKWQIWVDRFVALFTYKIIVGSTQVLKFTRQQEHLSKQKFLLDFNSADLVYSSAKQRRHEVLEKMGLEKEKTYIVTAGRLIEQKGHQYLIKAAVILTEKYPQVIFLIFGKGVLGVSLQKQILDLGLSNQVRLMGIGPMEEIVAISDIFVLPSLWEGLSIALVEAMNSCSPIVATKISGTEDVLENEKNSLLVPAGDSEQLVLALQKLLEDSNLTTKLAKAAQERSEDFSIQENIKKIEQLILGYFEHGS